jgi:hypothetical protein
MGGSGQECAEVTAKTLLEPKVGPLDPKRAVGRPMKAPRRGKRAPLSLLVRPEIKRQVDKLATANGTTQSAQAELLIIQGLNIQRVLDAMGKTAEEIESGNVNAALSRLGYRPRREWIGDRAWTSWCEPGHPRADEIDPGKSGEQGGAQ